MWNSSTCDWECYKTRKFYKYLDIKNCSWKKHLFSKLVSTCEKNNCFTHTILLVIICLSLLVVISISCYYYYTRHWIKKSMHCRINIKLIVQMELMLKIVRAAFSVT